MPRTAVPAAPIPALEVEAFMSGVFEVEHPLIACHLTRLRDKSTPPAEFRALVDVFPRVELVYERFPVKSRLHGGWKGLAFNTVFVGTFNALPRGLVSRYGWHLLAFCHKSST